MNPDFFQPNFIPDPHKQYKCSPFTTGKNFNYLHSLVLGGKDRLLELEYFIKTPEFTIMNSQTTENGWSALMLASRNSRTDSTEKTIEMLIPVSNPNLQDKDGWTALMMASRYCRTDNTEKTVEMLIPVSNPDLRDKDGWTALMMASRYSQTDSTEKTVEMLIPVSNPDLQSKDGCTALMMASRYSQTDSTEKTVEMLIPVSNPNLQHEDGWTALMLASRYSQTDSTEKTVEMLILRSNEDTINSAYLNAPECIFEVMRKCLKSMNNRLEERETFKKCMKEGISLPGATILSYI